MDMEEGTPRGWRSCLEAGWQSGAPALLDEADKARLVELLLQGPESLGYETRMWTCERVAHLVEKNVITLGTSGALRQLNWSVQQPVGWALERNEALIDDWKRRRLQ